MTVIACMNQKGGVGKTTNAVNLAYALSQAQKKKVVVIDLDPQGHTTLIFSGNKVIYTTTNMLFTTRRSPVMPGDAFNANTTEPIENLFLIPSNLNLALIAEQLSSKIHREKILNRHLEGWHEDKIVILDCPPNLGLLSINGIYSASNIYIPINYSRYALEGMSDLLHVIQEIKEGASFCHKIIRNNFDIRNSQTNQFVEDHLRDFTDHLFITKIRKCEAINQAQMNQECIFTFDPNSNGATDFNKLATEILGELNEQAENKV